MKDSNKKLLKYTSLASAVLGGAGANAQITYTNITDTTVDTHKGTYDLDLDQDGSSDFRITQYLDTGSTGLVDAIFIAPYDSISARSMGELQNGFSYPFKLVPGDSIGADELWNGNTETNVGYLVYQFDGTPYPNSNWKGPVTDGFMGLRILKTDGLHYGWVRLNVAADNRSFTVKDFAYNTVVNEGLLAAEPTLSAVEQMLELISIGQSGTELRLMKPSEFGEVGVSVFSIDGRQLAEFNWNDDQLVHDLNEGGAYVLQFEYNGLLHSKKVLLLED